MAIPFKPRQSVARQELKQLKQGFDNPLLDRGEKLIEWAVQSGSSAAVSAYRGEFLHQLALRSERRGNIKRAEQLFERSITALDGNALGLARTWRDYGMFMVMHGVDPTRGLHMIEHALALHGDDLNNQKGQRQWLITQTKLWRAQVLLGEDVTGHAGQQLIDVVLGPDFTFCVRDRKVLIDFLVPRTTGRTRRELLTAQAAIHVERRQLSEFLISSGKLVIDIELAAATTIFRTIFRKE